MPDGDIFAVNGIGSFSGDKAFGFNVETDLVPKEVKIDPALRLAALLTSHNIAVKSPCLFFVSNGVSEMEDCRHILEPSLTIGAVGIFSAAF